MQTDSTSSEPHNLTASDRLEGTPVRSMDGTTIGTIERVIIDQRSDNLACVVLSFNDCIGKRRLPIPCSRITYDRKLAAFNVDLTEQELSALADGSSETIRLALAPFRRIVKDYFLVCESYYEAIRAKSLARVEAIDVGRRSLHDEGSAMLIKRLAGKVAIDHATARRLFTLICVLHLRA